MTADVLSLRALNRATLERQLLLRRADMPSLDAVGHLVGLQAQVPLDPYTALWSRLAGFDPDELGTHLTERRLVRIVVMRATVHLVTAADALVLRPLTQPVLDAELSRHPDYSPRLRELDLDAAMAVARPLLARPHTTSQLRAALEAEVGDPDDAEALGYACRCLLPLVQVPPRGVWGRTKQVTYVTTDAWLGRPLAAGPSIDDAVVRYLAAFGPATVADVAYWSRLTGFREVLDRLRPRLRTFRDERGRELFDLPDAPRPDPDVPAPPRFLPAYDNALLSHADRTRFVADDLRKRLVAAALSAVTGSVLLDGRVAGTWGLERDKASGTATVAVELVEPPSPTETDAVEAEAERVVAFLAADASTRATRVHAGPG